MLQFLKPYEHVQKNQCDLCWMLLFGCCVNITMNALLFICWCLNDCFEDALLFCYLNLSRNSYDMCLVYCVLMLHNWELPCCYMIAWCCMVVLTDYGMLVCLVDDELSWIGECHAVELQTLAYAWETQNMNIVVACTVIMLLLCWSNFVFDVGNTMNMLPNPSSCAWEPRILFAIGQVHCSIGNSQ